MEEIAQGVWHWTSKHPKIGVEVSSYLLEPEGVVLDPMVPAEGVEWFSEHGPPTRVVLSNRHHDRDAKQFADALGTSVHVIREGLHEYEGSDLDVEAFDFGDELGGLKVHEVGVICPDETALEVPRVNALAIADGAMNYTGGELHFVPDEYIGDDPEAIHAGLRAAYARLADELEPDILLLAHGSPVVGDGAEALRRFASG